jgi:hypothetical protein
MAGAFCLRKPGVAFYRLGEKEEQCHGKYELLATETHGKQNKDIMNPDRVFVMPAHAGIQDQWYRKNGYRHAPA